MAEITVTIKYGKGYEETWAVFKGSTVEEVRALALEYFAISPQDVLTLSTHEVVVNLTGMAHGVGNAAAALGGVVVNPHKTPKREQAGDNPWAGLDDEGGDNTPAQAVPEQDPEEQRLLQIIENATTVAELQKNLWVKNRAGYDKYPSVVAAYKARGKELSGK